jgi:hypothetical protein
MQIPKKLIVLVMAWSWVANVGVIFLIGLLQGRIQFEGAFASLTILNPILNLVIARHIFTHYVQK